MARHNPLDPAWNAYLVTRDCIRIAQRAASRGQRDLFEKALSLPATLNRVQPRLEESRTRTDEFVIVSLWAEFERFLIAYLQRKATALSRRRPPALMPPFAQEIIKHLEYWRVEDILDLFKPLVGADRIGQAKQVKAFRDWVAHRNPNKPTPAKIDPRTAYALLSGIIEDVRKA